MRGRRAVACQGTIKMRLYPTPPLELYRRWTASHELSFSVSCAAELVMLLELLAALQQRGAAQARV